jgi:hypothetical protein
MQHTYTIHPSDGAYHGHTGSSTSDPIPSACTPPQERHVFIPGGLHLPLPLFNIQFLCRFPVLNGPRCTIYHILSDLLQQMAGAHTCHRKSPFWEGNQATPHLNRKLLQRLRLKGGTLKLDWENGSIEGRVLLGGSIPARSHRNQSSRK